MALLKKSPVERLCVTKLSEREPKSRNACVRTLHGRSSGRASTSHRLVGRGDVERALELTTPEIGERFSIGGEPMEWIERIRSDLAPHGCDHVALGLVDPSLIEAGRVDISTASETSLDNLSSSRLR